MTVSSVLNDLDDVLFLAGAKGENRETCHFPDVASRFLGDQSEMFDPATDFSGAPRPQGRSYMLKHCAFYMITSSCGPNYKAIYQDSLWTSSYCGLTSVASTSKTYQKQKKYNTSVAFISLSINYNLLIPNLNKSPLASCCNGELNCTTPGNIHTPAPQKVEISWGCGGGGEGV